MKKGNVLKVLCLITSLIICSYSIFVIWFYIKVQCDNKTNIDIPYLILDMYESPSYYCDLINRSVIEQDEKAIREFSLLDFESGLAHDHGYILVEIVLKVGEEKYLKSIENLSSEDKYWIKRYFIVGVENGREYYEGGNNWKELFPKIYAHMEKYAYLEK